MMDVKQKTYKPSQEMTKKQLAEMPGINFDGIAYFDGHPAEPTQVRLCDDGTIIAQHGQGAWLLPADISRFKKTNTNQSERRLETWRSYATSGIKIPFTVRVRMETVFVSFGRHRGRYRCDNGRLQRILTIFSQQKMTEYELVEADGDGSQLANQLREFLYQCVPDELKPNIKCGIKYRRRRNLIIISDDLRFKSDDFGILAKHGRRKTYHSES